MMFSQKKIVHLGPIMIIVVCYYCLYDPAQNAKQRFVSCVIRCPFALHRANRAAEYQHLLRINGQEFVDLLLVAQECTDGMASQCTGIIREKLHPVSDEKGKKCRCNWFGL